VASAKQRPARAGLRLEWWSRARPGSDDARALQLIGRTVRDVPCSPISRTCANPAAREAHATSASSLAIHVHQPFEPAPQNASARSHVHDWGTMFATLDQERHSRAVLESAPIVQIAPCSATRLCRQKQQTLPPWRFADRGKSQRQRDDACEIPSFAVAFPVLSKPDGPSCQTGITRYSDHGRWKACRMQCGFVHPGRRAVRSSHRGRSQTWGA